MASKARSSLARLLLASAVLLMVFGGMAFAEDANYTCSNYSDGSSRIRGDIDGDGLVTSADVAIVQRMSEGTLPIPFDKCCVYIPTAANPDPRMLVSVSAIQYLSDGNWSNAGTCAQPKTPTCLTCCTPEGSTMAIVPGNACCSGLTMIQPSSTLASDGTCQMLVGASLCSKCGNGTCEQWENKCNCAADCNASPVCTSVWEPVCGTDGKTYANECTAKAANVAVASQGECPSKLTESVRCVFSGSNSQQKCYSELASCSGTYDCKSPVTAEKGKVLTWKSSCAGENKTIVDGTSEEIKFDCSAQGCACTKEWAPVCGVNGKTYGNKCNAACENIEIAYEGECGASNAGIPLCMALGSKSEGWYDSATKQLIKWDNCRNCAARYFLTPNTCPVGEECSIYNYWTSSCTNAKIASAPTPKPACTLEGETMAVYPGNECCKGLTAIPTTSSVPAATTETSSASTAPVSSVNTKVLSSSAASQAYSSATPGVQNPTVINPVVQNPEVQNPATLSACQALVGASICSQCGNGNCEPWENTCNCPADCGETIKCPLYEKPSCPGGDIIYKKDEKKCLVPVCSPREKKYRYAKWTCSDGTAHSEGSPSSCKTESTWKEYARRSCGEICRQPEAVKENVKCIFANTTGFQKCYSDDQKFGCGNEKYYAGVCQEGNECALPPRFGDTCVADVYGEKGSTITWKSTCGGYAYTTIDGQNEYAKFDCSNVLPTTASASSGGASPATGQLTAMAAEVQPAASTTQASAEATAAQPVPAPYSSENCVKGEVREFSVSEECQNSGRACKVQAYDEIKAIKEKCHASNGKVLVTNDNTGCPQYSCEMAATECLRKEKIPEEKYAYCRDMNGELVVKTDDQGCVNFVECVGSTNPQKPVKVPDKAKLLELAFKLESLKVEFDKLIEKVNALAEYYSGKGDTNSADKFNRAAEVLQQAKLKVDEIKDFIKANIDSFDEAKAQQVKDEVSALKEGMLTRLLMILLE